VDASAQEHIQILYQKPYRPAHVRSCYHHTVEKGRMSDPCNLSRSLVTREIRSADSINVGSLDLTSNLPIEYTIWRADRFGGVSVHHG
jgi:hypothetical protein